MGILALLAGCAAPQHVAVLGSLGSPVNTGQRDRIEADSAKKLAASLAYGITPPWWLRTDAELAWRWSALHGYNHGQHEESAVGGVHVLALTGNAWLQPPFDWRVLPYVGGGAGPALQTARAAAALPGPISTRSAAYSHGNSAAGCASVSASA